MDTYNVLSNQWIRIRDINGQVTKVSVDDIIENAHRYSEIVEPNYQHTYGIINFLTALCISIYPLDTVKDKFELLKKGKFDKDIYDKKVQEWNSKRPGCFDLFSLEHPFYQDILAPYSKIGKAKNIEELKTVKLRDPAMIGKIALEIPSGHNGIHFTPDNLIGKGCTCEDVVKALISYTHFQAGQDGPNSASSVNGSMTYPIHYIYKGNNIFHLIVFNMLTRSTWNGGNDSKPYLGNTPWEMDSIFGDKPEVSIVSLVEGMTFQNRRVLLCHPKKDGKFYDVYFGPYRVYKESDKTNPMWLQPDASYCLSKKNEKEKIHVTVDNTMGIWTKMGDFFDVNSSNLPLTVAEYVSLLGEDGFRDWLSENGYDIDRLPFYIYYIGMKGGQMPAIQQGVYENYLPIALLNEDPGYLEDFNNCLRSVVPVGKMIFSRIVKLNPKANVETVDNYKIKFARNFYKEIESKYLSTFLQDILDVFKSDNRDDLFNEACLNFKVNLRDTALNIFKSTLEHSRTTGVWEVNGSMVGFWGLYTNEVNRVQNTINKYLNLNIKKGDNANEPDGVSK